MRSEVNIVKTASNVTAKNLNIGIPHFLWLPLRLRMRTIASCGECGRLYCPVPPNRISCGLPGTVSLRLSVVLREPVDFGVNVTLIEQLEPATNVDGATGQFVVSAKSAAFVPVIFGLLMAIGVPLGLPMVIV